MIYFFLLIAASVGSFAADAPLPQLQEQYNEQEYLETLEEAYSTIGVSPEAEQEKVDVAIREMKRRLQEQGKNALKEKNPSLLLQAQTKIAQLNAIEMILKNPVTRTKLNQWLQANASVTAYRTGVISAPNFAQKIRIKNALVEKAKSCSKMLTASVRRHYGELIATAALAAMGYGIEYHFTHPDPIMLDPNAVFVEGTSALAPPSSIRAKSPRLANGVELNDSDLAKCVTPEFGLGALVQKAGPRVKFVVNDLHVIVHRNVEGALFFADTNMNMNAPIESKKIITVSKGIVFQAPDEKWYFHPVGIQ